MHAVKVVLTSICYFVCVNFVLSSSMSLTVVLSLSQNKLALFVNLLLTVLHKQLVKHVM